MVLKMDHSIFKPSLNIADRYLSQTIVHHMPGVRQISTYVREFLLETTLHWLPTK
jgi:hypothetical protein